MPRYARWPAIVMLALAVAASFAVARALAPERAAPQALEQLEVAIAEGKADAALWLAYGQALQQAGRHEHAAAAFKRVLTLDAYHRDARIGCAQALAQSHQHDAFFAYMTDLTLSDAKLALDLLGQPELAPMTADPRFVDLQRDARMQAMD